MCLICQQLDTLSMAPWEARRNLQEVGDSLDIQHVMELMQKIERMEEDGI